MRKVHMTDQVRRDRIVKLLSEAKLHPLYWIDQRLAVLVLIALEIWGLLSK